jgi:hypothetical protein
MELLIFMLEVVVALAIHAVVVETEVRAVVAVAEQTLHLLALEELVEEIMVLLG